MRRVQKNVAKRGASWPLLAVLGAVMLGIVTLYAKNLLRAPPVVSWQGLVDQNGRVLDDQILSAQYKLVLFGFTQCASVCPLTLVKLRAVLDAMGPQRSSLSPLFVTVDPDHDNPSVLRSYTAAIDDRIVGVTGETATIDRLAEACGVYALRRPGTAYPRLESQGKPHQRLDLPKNAGPCSDTARRQGTVRLAEDRTARVENRGIASPLDA